MSVRSSNESVSSDLESSDDEDGIQKDENGNKDAKIEDKVVRSGEEN